jgi:hypothetical protein
MQQSIVDIAKERRNLVIALLTSMIIVNTIVFLTAGSDSGRYIGDITRVGSIGSALAISLIIVGRQGLGGLFGKAYAALAIALALWLVAESTWAYYELILGVESPFPSLADAFWLGAYAPFAYHVFSTAKFFGKGVKKRTALIVSAAGIIFLYFYIQAIVGVADLQAPDSLMPLAISIAYPLLDTILIIPAVLMVSNAGRGQLTSIPWIFVAWILLVIADSLLGITAVTGFTGETFHITMAYNASYLCFTAGLIWYNRLFIMSDKRLANDMS